MLAIAGMPVKGSRPRILIAEPEDFSPSALALLAGSAEVDTAPCDEAQFARAFCSYDVIWFRLGHKVSRALVEQPRRRCRVVATPVTGLDHIDLAACSEHGVSVVSLRGETEFLKDVRATAEMTVALALALLRKLPAAFSSVKEGRWSRDAFRGHELFGKRAGLVGVGRLGTLVARYLAAFGMDVHGYDPRPDYPEGIATRARSLSELLAGVDVVSIHVNLDSGTEGLIGERELGVIKPGAVLINTSRGAVVHNAALLAALRSGRLAGAALDVLAGEPHLPPDHPLLAYARTHDNLIITPHIGGNTFESFEKTELFLARRVLALLDGTS